MDQQEKVPAAAGLVRRLTSTEAHALEQVLVQLAPRLGNASRDQLLNGGPELLGQAARRMVQEAFRPDAAPGAAASQTSAPVAAGATLPLDGQVLVVVGFGDGGEPSWMRAYVDGAPRRTYRLLSDDDLLQGALPEVLGELRGLSVAPPREGGHEPCHRLG